MILCFWLVFLVFPLLLFLHPPTTPPTCPFLNRFLLLSIPFHLIYSLFFFPPCPRFKWHLLFFNASIAFLGTEAETGNAAGIASPDLQPLGQDDIDEGGNHGFFVDLRLWIFIFPLSSPHCHFFAGFYCQWQGGSFWPVAESSFISSKNIVASSGYCVDNWLRGWHSTR